MLTMLGLLVELLKYLLWILLGAGTVFLIFSGLAKHVEQLDPNRKDVSKTVTMLTVHRLLRLVIVAGLLFLAVKWNPWYAVAYVAALSLGIWVLAARYHKRAVQPDQRVPGEIEVEENV